MAHLLLLGGARSGKSALAVRLAGQRPADVWVIATAEPLDSEMAEKIRVHRVERPANWHLIEEPRDLERALDDVPPASTLILDCLTLWVSNLVETRPAEEILRRATDLAGRARSRPGLTLVVSNEVGLGLVPPNPLGRAFRNLLGQVNARWAGAADDVLLLVAGRAVRLEPVELDRWRSHDG
jgi:adenosylcobinamide kinase / adenosylcobinamide-phosphate guanylyltransferase